MSRRVRSQSQDLLQAAAPRAKQVLRAAAESGPNLGLLEWCLHSIQWHDADLIPHLQGGFPLAGKVPADPESPHAKVRAQAFDVPTLQARGVAASRGRNK